MERRTVRVENGNGRWLDLTVEDDRAFAAVGDPQGASDPFTFSLENLGFASEGMGFQAWGGGSHFAVRRGGEGLVLEFQRPGDRCAATVRLSAEGLRSVVDRLRSPFEASHAVLL